MDPYLERHWPDVYTKLVTYAADALNASLPPELIARTQERIAIESDADGPHHLAPDVRISEAARKTQPAPHAVAVSGAVELAPYRLVAIVEPLIERFIEIVEITGERLVTVIEIISPTNKQGHGLQAFKHKRDQFLAGDVNFVEIDLVRAGDWRNLLRPHSPPKDLDSPYRVTIRTANDPMAVYYHPIRLQQPLPAISIPLRQDDPPIRLDLQPLIEQAYMNGRYSHTLDYTQPLDPPPLDADDAAWTDELLKTAGRRP